MIKTLKIAVLVALASASVAAPAIAQSRYNGNELPSDYNSSGAKVWGSWGPASNGMNAFDQIPGRGSRLTPSASRWGR